MKPLYKTEEFDAAKSRDLLPFECESCKSTFHGVKNEIQKYFSRTTRGVRPIRSFKWCSKKCKRNGTFFPCKNCGIPIYKTPTNVRGNKNVFCCQSCSATYNNTHKTTGYRRSKLEVWLENELCRLYPNIDFEFNKTKAINAELDIYVPKLKLAFELNGIFHYEPIYSDEKLKRTQSNDKRKFQACLENEIELCIIDVSSQPKFTEKNSEKFLNIIVSIINQKETYERTR